VSSADSSLVDALARHASQPQGSRGYHLLGNGEEETGFRSLTELDRAARRIASWLAHNGMAGERVLLLLNDGLKFVDAFMGCLYAGTIPVPAAIPRPNRPLGTLHAIAAGAQIAGALIDDESAHLEPQLAPAFPSARWLRPDEAQAAPDDWNGRRIAADDVAFLQYTSGSTSAPKGVMVTHGNLVDNQRSIRSSMHLSEEATFVSWLPLFHDMGLIGGVLPALSVGIPCVLMPPLAFLQRPVRWLKAITKYRGTFGGAPNFAYDMCVDKVTEEERAALDLSSWDVAYNGSEPVRARTVERFSEAFAAAGFRRGAFYPCYGMAEATLLAAGGTPGKPPEILSVDPEALAQGQVREPGPATDGARLVSCGWGPQGTTLLIVDPERRTVLGERRVGEIWIRGGGVAAGYFGLPAETEETFGGVLAGGTGERYLRTGDLGFFDGGRLFITGRLKDLIIVRGRNYYPQDIEATAAASNPMLARDRGAAVAITRDGVDEVAIVHELRREGWRTADTARIAADVREAIVLEHAILVSRVYLIKPGALPRTSSGKVRRAACRSMIEAGTLPTLEREEAPAEAG
jgi:acyl-CoA synthetase (AMP-forming)/AMP-acid ligase II